MSPTKPLRGGFAAPDLLYRVLGGGLPWGGDFGKFLGFDPREGVILGGLGTPIWGHGIDPTRNDAA